LKQLLLIMFYTPTKQQQNNKTTKQQWLFVRLPSQTAMRNASARLYRKQNYPLVFTSMVAWFLGAVG